MCRPDGKTSLNSSSIQMTHIIDRFDRLMATDNSPNHEP